jgi:hypothetical protein
MRIVFTDQMTIMSEVKENLEMPEPKEDNKRQTGLKKTYKLVQSRRIKDC